MSSTPLFVTEESVDPQFNQPFVEVNEQRSTPVPHRYVNGGFKGTNARFSFYFPPQERYERRFFHNTYPMAISSDIGPFPIEFEVATGDLGFTIDSGAYYVQTNNGGVFRAAGIDPAIAAYRVNAAAAKYSRVVAVKLFGEHRPFGYLFGGSGGAYQTMGAAENTSGVWDGFVPFVPGCNHAIPSMFTVRMHALRTLRRRNRFPSIVDAINPGGSGDPYAELDEEERAALKEVSLMGYPLRGWYGHETLDSGYFANISGMIPAMDPTYVEDFWARSGYLGSDPKAAIRSERFQFDSTVRSASGGPPWMIELEGTPERSGADAHLVVLSGAAAGASLPIARTQGVQVYLIATADSEAAGRIRASDRVRIDNAWALALETYHRHQVPPTTDYSGWNQFRDANGKPIYPQRDVLIGPTGTANAAGSILNGNVHGKVLLLAALMDIDAYPWQADWYRTKIKEALGPRFEKNCALWYIDHAHHENPQTPLARANVVSYGGALQQALRDLAHWVEKGVKPAETRYRIEDTQVIVPRGAKERGGVQPVVDLQVNAAVRADVAVGTPVTFTATIEVPSGAGKVVKAEWDFEGAGDYTVSAKLDSPAEFARLTATHTYSKRGAYFPVLRATAHRSGDVSTPYARVQNIGRVRVVVS
jgi:hypothetical protein